MSWEIASAEDIGGRGQQQDRVSVFSRDNGETHLLVVADGMGGHVGGAAAAQAVIDTAELAFSTVGAADPQGFLEQLCFSAHQRIKQIEAEERPSPGSTCVFLLLKGEEAHWLHVGDSRLYLLQDRQVVNQTRDHSVVQLMISEGRMTEQEAATSGKQNQIYKRLGGDEAPEPDLDSTLIEDEDIFILSSDGFWGSVEPDEVMQGLSNGAALNEVVIDLVGQAKSRGGDKGDNISLILARHATRPKPKSGFFGRLFS